LNRQDRLHSDIRNRIRNSVGKAVEQLIANPLARTRVRFQRSNEAGGGWGENDAEPDKRPKGEITKSVEGP
jgi:hypothetical protein